MWDENVVPSDNASLDSLALPKLNLQFLTLQDYLLRNFTLFRLEAAYEIRQDIEDVVRRVNARKSNTGSIEFTGWARMSLPIRSFSVVSVGKPNLGEQQPSHVTAEVRSVPYTRVREPTTCARCPRMLTWRWRVAGIGHEDSARSYPLGVGAYQGARHLVLALTQADLEARRERSGRAGGSAVLVRERESQTPLSSQYEHRS